MVSCVERAPTALERLIAEPKGKVAYKRGEATLLHVMWQTPSLSAATDLLHCLQRCAIATHRDTPCVPLYFFRVSHCDTDLMPPAPTTIAQHPQIQAALKRLAVGTPRPAVLADLQRRQIEPSLIDLSPETPLPVILQQTPVLVECTELYLDESAFFEHAGSRDYLDAYGGVMQPRFMHRQPITLQMGNPTAKLCEQVLEPMLKAVEVELPVRCFLWRRPTALGESPLLISWDVSTDGSAEDVVRVLDENWLSHCALCVAFIHPLRGAGVIRLICVVTSLPSEGFMAVAQLKPLRGEVHIKRVEQVGEGRAVRAALDAAGLSFVVLNATPSAGYVIHAKAAELQQLL